VSDSPSQSALREWQEHMRHPITLAALIGTGAVMGVAGPFETARHLGLGARLLYWLAVCTVGYGIGSGISHLLSRRLKHMPVLIGITAMSAATGLLISLFILSLNAAVFHWLPETHELVTFIGTLFGISWIVTAVLTYAARHQELNKAQEAPPHPQPALPPILDRLPFEKRAALVALSVEDHYVRVHTLNGQEMILMRLSDAIREVGDTAGAQVHRSHWAAFEQVSAVRREGDRAILTMVSGADIPVSRANIHKIKEAGLLPR
jgi:DNA-binding LytR/AlgR family response regulator